VSVLVFMELHLTRARCMCSGQVPSVKTVGIACFCKPTGEFCEVLWLASHSCTLSPSRMQVQVTASSSASASALPGSSKMQRTSLPAARGAPSFPCTSRAGQTHVSKMPPSPRLAMGSGTGACG
jgi:hypothetical protein